MGLGYLLDSDIVIAGIKNKDDVIELEFLSRQADPAFISVISLFEVWDGIFGSAKVSPEKGKKELEDFLNKFIDRVFLIDEEISKKAGEIRAKLRRTGNLIGNLDILIAATCLINGLTLVTKNRRHFARIPRLEIL